MELIKAERKEVYEKIKGEIDRVKIEVAKHFGGDVWEVQK